MAIRCIAVTILATTLPLLAQSLPTGEKGTNDYSLEKEAALGNQLAAEMRQRTTPIENTVVQEYVNRLGRKLATNMSRANAQFTFTVIAEDPCPTVHEPAALPGGYVFVPAALFQAAQDEAEFAGMLAHAMVHIAERHGTRPATRGQVINYASVPLIFIGGSGGFCSEGLAIPLGIATERRSYEREADFLAVQTMAHAGLDPNALVRYTERVQPPQPLSPASAKSSTLPTRDQRVTTMKSGIAMLPAANYPAPADGKFAAAREAVQQFVPPNRPAPPSLRRKTPE